MMEHFAQSRPGIHHPVEYIIEVPLHGYTVTDGDEVLEEETFSLMWTNEL
jgi:hypothetical protein